MEQELPFEVPVVINGEPVSSGLMCLWTTIELHGTSAKIKTGKLAKQSIPSDHSRHLCTYHEADEKTVAQAIDGALAAKADWEAMPWGDRAAIFLKAADLVSNKYRYKLMAATMLGQGKNAWQAEIDAAAEVSIVGIGRDRIKLCLPFSAGGLLSLRGEVRRRTVFTATAEEFWGRMEVRIFPCACVVARF